MSLEIVQNKLNGVYCFRKYSSTLFQYNANVFDVPKIIINMKKQLCFQICAVQSFPTVWEDASSLSEEALTYVWCSKQEPCVAISLPVNYHGLFLCFSFFSAYDMLMPSLVSEGAGDSNGLRPFFRHEWGSSHPPAKTRWCPTQSSGC